MLFIPQTLPLCEKGNGNHIVALVLDRSPRSREKREARRPVVRRATGSNARTVRPFKGGESKGRALMALAMNSTTPPGHDIFPGLIGRVTALKCGFRSGGGTPGSISYYVDHRNRFSDTVKHPPLLRRQSSVPVIPTTDSGFEFTTRQQSA